MTVLLPCHVVRSEECRNNLPKISKFNVQRSARTSNRGLRRRYASEVTTIDEMKLNTLKCSFEVASSEFFGFIVNSRSIEADSKQINTFKHVIVS